MFGSSRSHSKSTNSIQQNLLQDIESAQSEDSSSSPRQPTSTTNTISTYYTASQDRQKTISGVQSDSHDPAQNSLRTGKSLSTGGSSNRGATSSIATDFSMYTSVKEYFLCKNLNLSQYRARLTLTLIYNLLFLVLEILYALETISTHSLTNNNANAALCIVEIIFSTINCILLVKLIYIPTRRSALLSAFIIILLEIFYICSFSLYYDQYKNSVFLIIVLVFMILQFTMAMLLYRYWEFVTFYYSGNPNEDGLVDLGQLVEDISVSHWGESGVIIRASESSVNTTTSYSPNVPNHLTPYGLHHKTHRNGAGVNLGGSSTVNNTQANMKIIPPSTGGTENRTMSTTSSSPISPIGMEGEPSTSGRSTSGYYTAGPGSNSFQTPEGSDVSGSKNEGISMLIPSISGEYDGSSQQSLHSLRMTELSASGSVNSTPNIGNIIQRKHLITDATSDTVHSPLNNNSDNGGTNV